MLGEILHGKVQMQEMRHECMLGVDGGAPIEGGLQSSYNTEVYESKSEGVTALVLESMEAPTLRYVPVKCTVAQMHEGTLSWDGWRASWMVSLLIVVISRMRMHCKLKEMEQQDKVCVLMLHNAGRRSKIPYRFEPQLTTYRNQYVGQPAKPVCFLCM